MKRDWRAIAGFLLGLTIAGVIFFANQLGLDKDPVWGMRRYVLFAAGVLIAVISLLYRQDNLLGRLIHTAEGRFSLATGFLVIGVLAVYVWCVSVGLWITWPRLTNYYDLLGTAFSHGQIALEVPPPAELLELDDPYNPENRWDIDVLWDMSYFDGKYYLYWGPAPALLVALVKPFYAGEVGDNILSFFFFTGIFIFLTLLILEIWKNYMAETPRWAVLLGIAFVALMNPIPFALLDSMIYEAAIGGGQFFFVGGLYWVITSFRRPSAIRLALAGVFFGLAVATRNVLLIPVAFLGLVVLIWAIKSHRHQAIRFVLAAGLPIALIGVGMAWYNYVRFGSISEFGLRYQFTSFPLHDQIDETFSAAYIPPNLFKILLNPMERRDSFPFVRTTRWAGPSWLEWDYPEFYLLYAEGITGLLFGSPFVIFAVAAGIRRKKEMNWILLSLAGSAFLAFAVLQFFFYTVMRYHLDFLPALALLALIGFWNGLNLLRTRPVLKWLQAGFGFVLFAYGLSVSYLLTISSHLHRFEAHNPDLLEQMRWLFNGIFK
ncbi:MAG: hypothetical protein AB1649_10175 [Chloroflexota bacterium]